MPAVAFNGSETNDVMTYDIYYRVWDNCHHTTGFPPRCVGGYWYYDDGASTISGTVNASSSNVFINGNQLQDRMMMLLKRKSPMFQESHYQITLEGQER